MPAEQKSELAFLPLQAARSERPGVPALTELQQEEARPVPSGDKAVEAKARFSCQNGYSAITDFPGEMIIKLKRYV